MDTFQARPGALGREQWLASVEHLHGLTGEMVETQRPEQPTRDKLIAKPYESAVKCLE